MEELQVIETTSGRQFKPWATKDDVQDPTSVTAVASEIASGKQAIAQAIIAKGGSASATESFSELAQDIQDTPTSGIRSNGIVQSEPFGFLDYVCRQGTYPLTEIDDDSVTVIDRPFAFYKQTGLLNVKMPALRTNSGEGAFRGCSALQEVVMPNLFAAGLNLFTDCTSLQVLNLPSLSGISQYMVRGCTSLKELITPNATTLSYTQTFNGCPLENIVLGTLVSCADAFYATGTLLRNVTIGQDTNVNLLFNQWTATNVIAEGQSGIDELNSNLYNNLLTKLYDHSQDGQTRTLRIGWLANVTAENIAYANAKGWTLTT